MNADRTPGPAFAPGDIGWIDFETRSGTPIAAGSYRYATEANAIILAYAIGDAPARTIAVASLDRTLTWADMPDEIRHFHSRVAAGEAVWAAWNAGFDKAIWNFATLNFPEMKAEHIIDVMAQAVASGLPPDLSEAARQCGGPDLKDKAGKKLIGLFSDPKSGATIASHPAEWAHMQEYASDDIDAMRSVFRTTRPLPLAEWQEYWAMEAVNERGACIDLVMVEQAARLAHDDRTMSSVALREITLGALYSVDHVKRMIEWLLARLPAEGRAILLKREEEADEDGALVKPAKFALTRNRVLRLIAYCEANMPEETGLLRLLQIRLYGGSKTPAKFARMLQQQVEGVLYGQYVFNGAAQTGRASSRGVQVHNLARDTLAYEPDAIDAIVAGADHRTLERLGDASPVARKLSLLIRPTFVPSSSDNVFVWSDWAQIEARVLPWLCDHLPGARARLQIFRDVDADPTLPDLYTRTAATLSQLPIDKVTKPIRQRGKVAELALGFCGGVGALQNMGAAYGLHLSDQEGRKIVADWRSANPWVMAFADEMWQAMLNALQEPTKTFRAGKVSFNYRPDYLSGSLWVALPSSRILTYRHLKWEYVEKRDDDDKLISRNRELTFARAYGRVSLWPGIFMENFTQATAADVLRGTLRRLEQEGFRTALHTHDECLIECRESDAADAAGRLRAIMRGGFEWSNGLPLMSEETAGYCYSKSEASTWAL